MNISERHNLAYQIQEGIYGIQWPANAQEPDYVAKIVNDLPSIVLQALTNVMPNRHFAVGSAFIHQKPLVHFVNKQGYKDPELGDLLVVCREKRFSGYVYNAMLLQAKRSKFPLREHIPYDHQFILYSEWPEFEYKRAGILNGKTRSVLPKAISQGAQYLLIDDTSHVELLTATVDIPLSASKLFARTMAAILSFDTGRTFQANSSRDDWSQMILDLLRISASAVFNRQRGGFVRAPRWNGNAAFNYILNLEDQEKQKDDAINYTNVNPEESLYGLGIICVDMGSSSNNND